MNVKYLWAPLVAGLLSTYAQAVVMEDGSGVTNWKLLDGTSSARVTTVSDATRGSDVIQFTGDGINSAYIYGYADTAWHNTTDKHLKWSMNYSEDYTVYVRLLTSNGFRFLQYTASGTGGLKEVYVHHILGASGTPDGTWKEFSRDLEADLKQYEPYNSIIEVNGIIFRGSGKIDDVELYSDNPDASGNLPIANAGSDANVNESSVVQLDGSASSDADSDPLTYQWSIVTKPNGSSATLSDSTAVNPTFVADVTGIYTIQLVVNDGQDNSAPDTVEITSAVYNNMTLNVCDVWSVSNSGGSAGTLDVWDISAIPAGASFDFEFEAYSVPDKFKVEYENNVVLDSGWRGSYAPAGEILAGPGTLNEYGLFVKTNSDSTQVVVSGGQSGTLWNYRVRCVAPVSE